MGKWLEALRAIDKHDGNEPAKPAKVPFDPFAGSILERSAREKTQADAVVEETGREIERRLVQLDDPIREVGEYDVPIRLHADISASIKVVVYATGTDPLDNSVEEVAEGDQAVVDSSEILDDPVNRSTDNEEDTLAEDTNVSITEEHSEPDEDQERTE